MNYIYKITNTITNKIYIGITNNYQKRMREHSYGKGNSLLAKSIRKYGWDNFVHELIEETDNRDRELAHILEFQSKHPLGYNLTEGGEGCVGFEPNENSKNKMRKAKLGNTLSVEHKKKISESLKGRKLSRVAKSKISKKLENNKNFEGHTFSKESREKLSKGRAKEWIALDPDGNEVKIYNMRKFCIENNLSNSAMSSVLSDKIPHHKGWRKPS